MEPQGVYVYCFARAGVALLDVSAESDGGPAVAALEVGRVTAVFSRVSLDDFSAKSPSPRSEDPEWVVSRACRHDRIVEQVMRMGPVLPVKFGTVFSSEQALRLAVDQMGDGIAHVLDRLADKEEWAAKVFIDAAKAREWLLATDPVLAARRRDLPAAAGRRYLQAKSVDAEVDTVLRHWRASVAEEIQGELGGYGMALHPLKLQPRNVSGRGADMALNLAMLVKRNRVAALEARVRELAGAFADQGIVLEVTGPWPPYHFCPPPEPSHDEASALLHSA
jgi:hypothetical protein